MDSPAYPRRHVAVDPLAANGFAAVDGHGYPPDPSLIATRVTRASPAPAAPWPALEPNAPTGLVALIGTLSLRAVRSQGQP
jgi:hypothetical protein